MMENCLCSCDLVEAIVGKLSNPRLTQFHMRAVISMTRMEKGCISDIVCW